MEAGKKTLNDIFNGSRVLEIPFFQRSYVWEEEQWERLLDDMENINNTVETHFFGSIILKQKETMTSDSFGDRRTVVDGQQRITTLNIFFKVLFLKNDQMNIFDRTFRLDDGSISLKHNLNDVKAFNRIMDLKTLEDLEANDTITKAYRFFKDKIDPDKLDFNRLRDNILFVGIDLASDEDEQQIFDTINSLGVKLTTSELLKNYFFDRDDINLYKNSWENVFEVDEETKEYWDREITAVRIRRTSIDLFFYAFLQIKIQDVNLEIKSEDKKDFSRVDKLFESYKKFTSIYYNGDKKKLIAEIKEYAELYRSIFNPDIIYETISSDYGLDRINLLIFGLSISTLIPYILFIEKNIMDETVKNDLYQVLESYIMRRNIVRASARGYNNLFTDRFIRNQILSKDEFMEYIKHQSGTSNYWPSNDEVVEGFFESRLTNRNAAGVLYLIESNIRGKFHSTQLLGFNKYSLEHIMPKKWENHWEMPDNNYTSEDRNRILLTFGNLTIITQSLNSSIRDSEWLIKLNGNDTRDGLSKYTKGIETIQKFIETSEWNENIIKKRAKYLSDHAIKIWSK